MHKYLKKIVTFILIGLASASDISQSRQTALTKAIEKIGPAVASINIEQHVSSISFDPFFGFMFPRELYPMKSSGSGVVISPDGFVLTNVSLLVILSSYALIHKRHQL